MTWPFENDTSDIEKKLAKRSLHRERQRNLFAIIALVLTCLLYTSRQLLKWRKKTEALILEPPSA